MKQTKKKEIKSNWKNWQQGIRKSLWVIAKNQKKCNK